MQRHDKDWSKTDHPFIPELRERIKRLRGLKRAEALYGLAHALWEEEEFLDAVETLDKAAPIFDKLGYRSEQAFCHRMAALCLKDNGQPDDAKKRLEFSRLIFLDAGSMTEVAECDVWMALLMGEMGRADDGVKRLDAAQAIFQEMECADDAQRCIRIRADLMR